MGRERDRGDRNGGGHRSNPNRPDFKADYKDIKNLKRFVSEDGKILPRRRSGLTAKNQRSVTTAVKRARHLAMLPYTSRD